MKDKLCNIVSFIWLKPQVLNYLRLVQFSTKYGMEKDEGHKRWLNVKDSDKIWFIRLNMHALYQSKNM